MLSATTRAAACVVRWLVAAVSRAAGTVILVSGLIGEDVLMQGTLIGSITGGLDSLEVVDSLVRLWRLDDGYTHTPISSMPLQLRNLAAGGLAIIGSSLHQRQPHYFSRGDLFEPDVQALRRRRAAVESLPAMTVTEETDDAGQQTSCPICLDEFQAGERARRLPACSHVFHLACIDSWLMWNYQCPICRHAVY